MILVNVWLYAAAKSLNQVATTRGDDIGHVMGAMRGWPLSIE
jgi:hypothetical protein